MIDAVRVTRIPVEGAADATSLRPSDASPVTFESVFAAERTAMMRLAYLLLGSETLAEEAVQDAFARLLDRFDRVDNPGGYVRTATVNRCRDLLRRRRHEERVARLLRTAAPASLGADHLHDVLGALTDLRGALDDQA